MISVHFAYVQFDDHLSHKLLFFKNYFNDVIRFNDIKKLSVISRKNLQKVNFACNIYLLLNRTRSTR